METPIRAWGGAVCSTWRCPKTGARTCGHPHMGGLTPQVCKVPVGIPGGRQSIWEKEEYHPLPQKPLLLWTSWASGPPKDGLWPCLRQRDYKEGAFLKSRLMRTRENPIWINHESKVAESSQNKSEELKPHSPKSEISYREGTGMPRC